MYCNQIRKFKIYLLFFLLGLLLFQTTKYLLLIPKENYPLKTLENFSGNMIVWKLRDHSTLGNKITLSVQHRFQGEEGAIRYLVFESLSENFGVLNFIEESDRIQVNEENQWSTWTFKAKHPILFVGVAWESKNIPIYLQRQKWDNSSLFNNYAFKGNYKSNKPHIENIFSPAKANFVFWESESQNISYSKNFLITFLLIFLIILCLVRLKIPLTNFNLVYVLIGYVFGYRLEASFNAPYWTWGSYYLSFLSTDHIYLLCFLYLILTITFIFLPPHLFKRRVHLPIWLYSCLVFFLVYVAWSLPCNRVYHDWVYSITNPVHAPLTSIVFRFSELVFDKFGLSNDLLRQSFSIAVYIPFLYVLRLLLIQVDTLKTLSLWGIVFFLSLSTSQLFYRYVGIHSLPTLYWLSFCYISFRVLNGQRGLLLASLVAFLAYISRVAEALLVFPLIYLWAQEIFKGNLNWSRAIKTILIASFFALIVIGITYYGIFLWKFNSDYNKFISAYPYYGYELLWGSLNRTGLVLPYFDANNLTRSYSPPGPHYAMFSLDNIIRVLNTGFHYSAFCFLLPVILIVKSRFVDLKDSKVLFCFISYITYGTYMFIAYVGWIPVIRDWDLFAAFSIISATLLYLLLISRRMYNSIALIAMLNLLQTIPWLIINHFQFKLPW